MAESHQLDFAGLYTLDELGNLLDRADLQEHVKDFFIGAAVERTVESGDRRGRGGIRIDVGAADAANSVGRAVLLVVGMKNKENVEGAFQRWIRPVLWLGSAKEHVQEIAGIAELSVRIHERHAQSVPIGEVRDGRDVSKEAIRLLLDRQHAEDSV